MSARPNAKEVKWVVYAGRSLTVLMASFDTEEEAEKYKESADLWYGKDHPLTPFKVSSIEHNAPLWPNPSNIENMFDHIDD